MPIFFDKGVGAHFPPLRVAQRRRVNLGGLSQRNGRPLSLQLPKSFEAQWERGQSYAVSFKYAFQSCNVIKLSSAVAATGVALVESSNQIETTSVKHFTVPSFMMEFQQMCHLLIASVEMMEVGSFGKTSG